MPVKSDTNDHRKSSNLTLPPFDSILESYFVYTDAKRENTPPPKKFGLTGEYRGCTLAGARRLPLRNRTTRDGRDTTGAENRLSPPKKKIDRGNLG